MPPFAGGSRVLKPARGAAVPACQPFPWELAPAKPAALGPQDHLPPPTEPVRPDSSASQQAEMLERRIRELEILLEQRSREAFRAGEEAARKELQNQVDHSLSQLAKSVADLSAVKSKAREEARQEVVELALAVARRILHRELSVAPDALQGVVAVALEKLRAQDIRRVYTHPRHENQLRQALAALAPSQNIEVAPSDALPLGGIKFETAQGQLDASIDTQLDEIRRGLADRLNNTP